MSRRRLAARSPTDMSGPARAARSPTEANRPIMTKQLTTRMAASPEIWALNITMPDPQVCSLIRWHAVCAIAPRLLQLRLVECV